MIERIECQWRRRRTAKRASKSDRRRKRRSSVRAPRNRRGLFGVEFRRRHESHGVVVADGRSRRNRSKGGAHFWALDGAQIYGRSTGQTAPYSARRPRSAERSCFLADRDGSRRRLDRAGRGGVEGNLASAIIAAKGVCAHSLSLSPQRKAIATLTPQQDDGRANAATRGRQHSAQLRHLQRGG